MRLLEEQWTLVAPLLPGSPRRDGRGRPRKPDRDILEGILWILKTGAQWNELPREFPPYQTCHRRFQEWARLGIFEEVLRVLAEHMMERGKLKLEECFMDGTFASAKKGGYWLVRRSVERAPRSWLSRTRHLFRSPSIYPLLLRTKSPWWRKHLPPVLRAYFQDALSLTEPTTLTLWTGVFSRTSASGSSAPTGGDGHAGRRRTDVNFDGTSGVGGSSG